MIGAAAAWERNGSLDAISRAFSYLFARPLQFFWNYFLIFLFVGVVLLVGHWFTYTLTKSMDAGVWSDRLSVLIDAPERLATEGSDYSRPLPRSPGRPGLAGREDRLRRGRPGAPGVQPFAKDFEAVLVSPWTHKLNALIFWVAINLIWLGVFGYAIYWFLGATTSVYADLRADVDGTEEDEIYLEEEEEDFDALAEAAGKAEPTPAEGAPATPPTPAEPATAPTPGPPSGGDAPEDGTPDPPDPPGPLSPVGRAVEAPLRGPRRPRPAVAGRGRARPRATG